MVDIFASEKLKALYPKIKAYVQEELIPLEDKIMHMPFKEVEATILNDKRAEVKKMGWWAPHLSEKDGGLGLELVDFGQLSEVLAHSPVGHYVFNCQAPDIGNMELLHKYASDDVKGRFLQPLMDGKLRSCFSMTEPEFAGSNPVRMATSAVKDGTDYVINGHKWFTTAADGASFAVVMANTSPDDENKYARASMIVVPTDNPGFEIVRNIPIMGEAGEGYMSHAEVRYKDCRVPQSNIIGGEGMGFMLAQERLGPGRIHHCMRWIGISERALGMMCQYAASRELSSGRMLGHMQTIQNWIAESRAEINAARYMVLHTAHKIDQQGNKASKNEISTIKFFVANILQQVIDRAIQAHGALGVTDDTILSWYYRHERGARIYDGPDEVHKSVVARSMLGEHGLNLRKSK
ncbi:MAG: acyl-CoA dehydrogenase family protein [Cyclobacteriaceae bacterium]